MQVAIDLLTAAAALIGAAAGVWNAWQFAVLKGRVDTLERHQTAHVNAAGLHGSTIGARSAQAYGPGEPSRG